MGSSQSSLSTSEITDAPINVSSVKEHTASTKNGPKTKSMGQTNLISITLEDGSVTDSDASIVSAESDYSSDEEEEDEYSAERRTILEEARKLRELAGFYYHPEAPVASDATACARGLFSRYSAPGSDSNELEDEEERQLVLADTRNLKELAVWHMHPEKPVESSDASAFGRNYFTRPSATEYEVNDMEEERELILQEMKQLKTTAEWYMHPEASVVSDASACARNFFSRPSAPVNEEEEERVLILKEMKQLKTTAEWYMHPEKPVAVDSTSCGRNFFTRPSAPDYEDEEDLDERERILEELKELKTEAEWYMHPEKPVSVDPAACGRNYFSRSSAPEYDEDDMEERDQILEEMKELKTIASWYMHPEKPIEVDATACARNFFTRPSAQEEEDDGIEEERIRVMEDVKALKTTAEWYLHPEKPVAADSSSCGRNYFTRPSAFDDDVGCVSWVDSSKGQQLSMDFESNYNEEEQLRVMEDVKALKTVAEWYLHPEKPVAVDSSACGRNYFTRPSAFDDDVGCVSWVDPSKGQQISMDFQSNYNEEERLRVMEDVKALKTTAEWYLQPEKPVAVDSSACGRNYFTRPSAFDDNVGCVSWVDPSKGQQLSMDFESNYNKEMEAERKCVLAESKQLKEVASWYLQPEKSIDVDSTVFGRNYFSRPSAPEQEDEEDIEELELILAEVNELKLLAEWYRNPEEEVTVYSTACGRNFFTRPSAPIEEEDAEEREEILADAAELLEVAKWYMFPENPVTVYATACGRNFFSRPSILEEEEDDEMVEERLLILAEAKQLKEVAGWYANPSQPVKSDGFSTGRNYFSRPSAPEYTEDSEEREQVLAEAKKLKEVAGWYHNPEQPVKSDGFASARSFFTRPSAPEQVTEDIEEHKQIVAEAKELKKIASWYLEPEKPISVDSATFGRNYFTRPSAEQPTEKDDEEERSSVISDATELKKLAVDYLHPEKPVLNSSVNCARNYFERPSATGHADHIHTEGYANHSTIHNDYVHEGYDFQEGDYHDHSYLHSYQHDCDTSHQSYTSHGDHFDMDEDLSGFRDSMTAFRDSIHHPVGHEIINEELDVKDGKEGNLSRSPSSIMLFDEQVAI